MIEFYEKEAPHGDARYSIRRDAGGRGLSPASIARASWNSLQHPSLDAHPRLHGCKLFPEGRQRHAIPRFSGADTRIKSGISALDAPMHGWTGEGRTGGNKTRFAQKKKRGVPRLHGKHAAWELLSPDLRCF
jgi:hypothetical protein